jgi:chemotaxis protein MotB
MAAAPKGKDGQPVRPIIIKRKKIIAAGHHGGAWKVAYADFVTAMMAFFLVMWLVAAATPEQRAAVFEYFKNPSMEKGVSPKAAPGQNGPGGASKSVVSLGGAMEAPRSSPDVQPMLGRPLEDINDSQREETPEEERARKMAEAQERRQLDTLQKELRKAIDKSQALKPFKDQLLLDITPEGLRIQIVDTQNRPMFDLGSTLLKDYTTRILRELGPYLNSVPNRVSIAGHTDTTPYAGGSRNGYSNWELSADRGNAARRALIAGGLAEDKVARVVGVSSAILFDKANPRNPINRRISIIVMTKKAEKAALQGYEREQPGAAVGRAAPTSPAATVTRSATP